MQEVYVYWLGNWSYVVKVQKSICILPFVCGSDGSGLLEIGVGVGENYFIVFLHSLEF